ncbi:MAG: hypothetical protein NZ750_00390 [Anaerolineae bacterium]|nr:hypothetical protein [Anaerolineae bacterium]MDW8173043.1 hypothetical protein [Anaerolineae bacterium]
MSNLPTLPPQDESATLPAQIGVTRPSAPVAPHAPPRVSPMSPPYVRPAPRIAAQSAFYLPWWSLILLLIVVLVVAVSLVLLTLALGNNGAVAIQNTPEFRVLTAQPLPDVLQAPLVSPEALVPEVIMGHNQPTELALIGPTLPPVVFTPTPFPISVGVMVIVQGVGDQQLNVRDRPGVMGTTVLFRSAQGTLFTVLEGPAQADGFAWWRIQDTSNPAQQGWAVSNYLRPIAPP